MFFKITFILIYLAVSLFHFLTNFSFNIYSSQNLKYRNLTHPSVLTGIIGYTYELTFIVLIIFWLIKYRFKIPNRIFYISTGLFLILLLLFAWAIIYGSKNFDMPVE